MDWKKHKLESRLPEEISITSDTAEIEEELKPLDENEKPLDERGE